MARVIVILALMLLISAVIFGVTRKSANLSTNDATDARTTVPLGELADDVRKTVETSVLDEDIPGTGDPAVASAQDVMTGTMSGAAPSFTSVGVDHKSRASFTGTAAPGSQVSIVRDGKILGTAKSDISGSWTIDFKVPDVREDFDLHAVVKDGAGHEIIGPQRALVSPPSTSGGLPRITLMAAELKTETVAPANAKGEPDVGIIVEKITAGAQGAASLTGKADPGATLKATINDKAAGETVVQADGSWSMAVKNDTGKDASGIRLGLLSDAGKQLDRTDVPFKLSAVKLAQADPAVPATPAFTSVTDEPAEAVGVPKAGRMIKIRRGDSLWRIAKRHYGNGRKWKAIFKANRGRISNPDVIYAGRRLVLPG